VTYYKPSKKKGILQTLSALPETDIAPEKWGLGNYVPFGRPIFRGELLVLGRIHLGNVFFIIILTNLQNQIVHPMSSFAVLCLDGLKQVQKNRITLDGDVS